MMSDYTLAVYEATIADLRAQLAERDAQLAAAYAGGQEVMRMVAQKEMERLLTNHEGETYGYHCDKALNAFRNMPIQPMPATCQPTQDKGEV